MDNYCCVFGHSDITITKELIKKLNEIFENLIIDKKVNCFFFGGFGNFDDFCYKTITELKHKYQFIKRIYVCEDYKYIDRPHKRPWLQRSLSNGQKCKSREQ